MKQSVVPLAGHGLRPPTLRRRASRPQLKRDPLGRYEHQPRFTGGRRRASTERWLSAARRVSTVRWCRGAPRTGRPHRFRLSKGGRARRDSGRVGAGPGAFRVPCQSALGGRPPMWRYKVSPVGVSVGEHRPNKRLKLAGAYRSKGTGVLCPGGHELSVNVTTCGGRVARSLSAIR